MSKDSFEKAFGKAPESGYEFKHIEIEIVDNATFKGFDIGWSASGIGFGHVWFGWGLDVEALKEYPNQKGFYTDSEYMSDEFIQALMKEVAPKLAEIIIKHDNSNRRKDDVSST